MVVLAVVVEPRLHRFREILVVIHARVFALPQAGLHRSVEGGLEPRVEGRVHICETAQMDVVRELVDENALGGVRIAGIAEQIFLSAGAERVAFAAAESAGAGVPVILRSDAGVAGHRSLAQADELRLVHGELVPRYDAHARAALDHRGADVGAVGQHLVHEERGLLERVGIHLGRGDDGETVCSDALGVERRHAVLACRVETEALHAHLAADDGLSLVLAADYDEAMADGRGDYRVLAWLERAVRHALGCRLEPEDVGGLQAAVDDLKLGTTSCLRAKGGTDEQAEQGNPAGHAHALIMPSATAPSCSKLPSEA